MFAAHNVRCFSAGTQAPVNDVSGNPFTNQDSNNVYFSCNKLNFYFQLMELVLVEHCKVLFFQSSCKIFHFNNLICFFSPGNGAVVAYRITGSGVCFSIRATFFTPASVMTSTIDSASQSISGTRPNYDVVSDVVGELNYRENLVTYYFCSWRRCCIWRISEREFKQNIESKRR